MTNARVLVTGAGGFLGHHLVAYLQGLGHWVRGVDLKKPEFEETRADEFLILDLRRADDCLQATRGVEEVYATAADMGGMGYISCHHSRILRDNLLIDLNTLEAARQNTVARLFYASSACVYPMCRQNEAQVVPLGEDDAYPAEPQGGYGWEKLTAERLCTHYCEEHGIKTRIARLHNIFGPRGAWEGGREKAPAALCRKIAWAKLSGSAEIEIWGDGEQTRSFCYVDDCIEGIHRVMRSDYHDPLNLGQERLVAINELADMIADIAGIRIVKRYVDGPQGVRGRTSDNTRLKLALGWEPEVSLEEALVHTYQWIEGQVRMKYFSRHRAAAILSST
jgi:nucleoside-diphosphate-sugar epimerase